MQDQMQFPPPSQIQNQFQNQMQSTFTPVPLAFETHDTQHQVPSAPYAVVHPSQMSNQMQGQDQMQFSLPVQSSQPCPIYLTRGQVYFHPANQCRLRGNTTTTTSVLSESTHNRNMPPGIKQQ
jgi:hypothetical protein